MPLVADTADRLRRAPARGEWAAMPQPADRADLAADATDDPARLIDDRSRLYDDRSRLPENRVALGWLDALVRHRRLAFALVGLLYLASFNGLWRAASDSALYRGIGHSLATGRGYTFAGEHNHHAFPGLPWMLAGCEWLFGVTPVPGQLLITLMALATIAVVYRLIALHYPLWVATVVALAMGANFRFLRLSQELMTDVPFTLGVAVALYGLERLRMAGGVRRPTVVAAAQLLAGLVLAAVMRPMIGVLAGAIVAASAVRLVTVRDGRRRALHAAVTLAAAAVVGLLLLVVARARGVSLTGGVYEQELIEKFAAPTNWRDVWTRVDEFLGSSLNDAFFSQKLQPFSIPAALVLLAGSALVLRRNLAWGLMVVGTVVVTLPLSTVPRYYLMVMPILWLGWLLLLSHLTLRCPPLLRGAVMLVGIATPIGMNLGRDLGFAWDQRSGDVAWALEGANRADAFYKQYKVAPFPTLRRYAAAIAAHAKPDDRVIGPDARILTYLSDRRVTGERELFELREIKRRQYPFELARFQPDLAIFPSGAYGDGDRIMRDLINRRVIAPTGPVLERIDFAWLAAVKINTPPANTDWKDWRASSARENGERVSATQRAARAARRDAAEARERRERVEAAQRRERQAIRDRRDAQAAKDRRDAQAAKDRRDAQAARDRREARERRERNAGRSTGASRPAAAP